MSSKTASQHITITQICDKLIKLEDEFGLFQWQIQGVYVWPLLRMPIYYELTKKLGVFGAPHGTSQWKGRRFKRSFLWSYALFKHLFSSSSPCDLMIVEHPRKVKKDAYWVDIYTDALIQRLKKEQQKEQLPESYSLGIYENLSYQSETRHNRRHPHAYYDPIMTKARLFSKFFKTKLTSNELKKSKQVEQALFTEFKIRLDLHKKISKRISEFKSAYRSYHNLLTIRQPKALLVVVSYSHSISPLIAAAKNLAIPTIEMQHGTFSPYHLGYHFPQLKQHPYFCDYFFSFGPFWHQMAHLPLEPHQIKAFGFQHMHEQLSQTQLSQTQQELLLTNQEQDHVQAEPTDSVLFLSQGVIGQGLSEYAVACSKAQLKLRLRYKLHPSEYNTWRSDYPNLAMQADAGMLEVIDHHRIKLYDLMRDALYQVGVFSTAVYEGMALGCKTLLVDLPGLEYMDALIEQEFAEKINSPQELCQRLRQLQESDDKKAVLAKHQEQANHQEQAKTQLEASQISSQIFAEVQEDTVQWLLELIKK